MVVEMAAHPVVDADLGDIAKFLTLSFGGSESHYRQLFSYWWESNASWHGGLPKGWAIKSPDGDIIAFTANIPFAYVINGQAGKCFVTGYTCVDENWRGHKLSKKIGERFPRSRRRRSAYRNRLHATRLSTLAGPWNAAASSETGAKKAAGFWAAPIICSMRGGLIRACWGPRWEVWAAL